MKQKILLLPHAIIITFGVKAKNRVKQIKGLEDRVILDAWALAPPVANRRKAKQSWESVTKEFHRVKKIV